MAMIPPEVYERVRLQNAEYRAKLVFAGFSVLKKRAVYCEYSLKPRLVVRQEI